MYTPQLYHNCHPNVVNSVFLNYSYILQEIEETQRTDGMRKAKGYLHIYKHNFQKFLYYVYIHKFHSRQNKDFARGDSAFTAKVKPLFRKTL